MGMNARWLAGSSSMECWHMFPERTANGNMSGGTVRARNWAVSVMREEW